MIHYRAVTSMYLPSLLYGTEGIRLAEGGLPAQGFHEAAAEIRNGERGEAGIDHLVEGRVQCRRLSFSRQWSCGIN